MKASIGRGKRQMRAQMTRARLGDAAIRLILSKGYDNITVHDIAEEAGASVGAFYNHFTTKSDIILELFKNIDDEYVKIYERIKLISDPTERLTEFVRGQLSYLQRKIRRPAVKLLYTNQLGDPNQPEHILNEHRALAEIIVDIFKLGQNEGCFRTDLSAEQLMHSFLRAMRGLYLDWTVSHTEFDLVQDGAVYLESFLLPALTGK